MGNPGFIGMGVMGAPMAKHLLAKGHDLTVWNRTPGKAEKIGAAVAESIQELANKCDPIFLCVSRTEDVEEVVTKIEEVVSAEKLIIDHSTIEPAAAKRIAERLNAKGIGFLDAPLTGGEKGAINGQLTIFCGGRTQDYNKAKPYMEAYAKVAKLVGPSGSGQMMKMANQISVALCVLAMCESLVFCEKAGLDMAEAIELVGGGAGGSWSLTNYGPKVLERDWSPGFAVALQQKDLRYALDSAKDLGIDLPGTKLVHSLFGILEEKGRANEATPALFEVIENL